MDGSNHSFGSVNEEVADDNQIDPWLRMIKTKQTQLKYGKYIEVIEISQVPYKIIVYF